MSRRTPASRMKTRVGLLGAALLLFAAGALQGQSTDAEAMAELLRTAAKESVPHCRGRQVGLLLPSEGLSPMVEQVFAEELFAAGRSVLTVEEGSESVLRLDVRDMHSSTAQSTNSSYFRKMELTLGVLVEETAGGRLLWSREFTLSRTDTLDGTAPYAERSWLDESPSWWESFYQPALLTLTAGVIALLLFTVRGSS